MCVYVYIQYVQCQVRSEGDVSVVACSQYDSVVIYPKLASRHLTPVGMAPRSWRARWPFKCHRAEAKMKPKIAGSSWNWTLEIRVCAVVFYLGRAV